METFWAKTYDDPEPLSDGELSETSKNEARRSYIDNGPKILGLRNREDLEMGSPLFAVLGQITIVKLSAF